MEKVTELLNSGKPKGGEYAETTKEGYIKVFRKLSNTFGTDDFHKLFSEQYDHVVEVLKKNYSDSSHWHKVNTYCKYFNIPCKEIPLRQYESKIGDMNIYQVRKTIEAITDMKAKVFLSLLSNKSDIALRRDWATVMIRDFCTEEEIAQAKGTYNMKTGVFDFTELNKSANTLTFEIEDKIKELLREYIPMLEDKRYLYNYSTRSEPSDKHRIESYTQYISRITLKYLGEKLSTNDFRKSLVGESHREIEESGNPSLEKYISSAAKKDHSPATELKYYTKSKEGKTNISTQTEPRIDPSHTATALELAKLGWKTAEILELIHALYA